jgi:hypothetical protein
MIPARYRNQLEQPHRARLGPQAPQFVILQDGHLEAHPIHANAARGAGRTVDYFSGPSANKNGFGGGGGALMQRPPQHTPNPVSQVDRGRRLIRDNRHQAVPRSLTALDDGTRSQRERLRQLV